MQKISHIRHMERIKVKVGSITQHIHTFAMRRWMMLLSTILFGFSVVSIAPAQENSSAPPPQMLLQVAKYQQIAEMVTITMLDANYSQQQLRQQIDALSTELGVPPRGLSVFDQSMGLSDGNSTKFVRASFATNGLIIDSPLGLNIQAIARAFAPTGKGKPLQCIRVQFMNVQPDTSTLHDFSIPETLDVHHVKDSADVLAYEIVFKSGANKPIEIPLRIESNPVTKTDAGKNNSNSAGFSLTALIAILAGGLILGGLVYFLVLKALGFR